MQQENLRILKTELYTEQMHENLTKIFQLHNSRIKVDKMIKLKKCSFIILSSKQKRVKARGQKNELDHCYPFGKTVSQCIQICSSC